MAQSLVRRIFTSLGVGISSSTLTQHNLTGSHATEGTSPSDSPIIPLHLSEAIPIFRDIPDLSSELEILSDHPVVVDTLSPILRGEISNGQQVAVKLLAPDINIRYPQVFFRELYVWSHAMPHEHVLPLLGIARLGGSVAFISPWMPGQESLEVQLADCSVPEKLRILAEIAEALVHLHHKNLVYAGNVTPVGSQSDRQIAVVLDQTKKAYLSNFRLAQTDWTELSKIDSRLFSGETPSGLYRHKAQSEDDVTGFGILALSTMSYKSPATWQNHEPPIPPIIRLFALLHTGILNIEELGFPDIPNDIWIMAQACLDNPGRKPTMEQVSAKLSNILESLNGPSHNFLKDISFEIKGISQYPVAEGSYGDLYSGERLGREKVALKLVRLSGSTDKDKQVARKRFMDEARIWAGLYHHRILEFYGICKNGTLRIYMVSPFLLNGNIMRYLNEINSDANRRKLLVEVAEGLVYLHNRTPPVLHGDLKGGNILISDGGTALLADFGLSRISHEAITSALRGAGSFRWMAPELLKADVNGPLRTIQSDVYGYGHLMLEVLSNQQPFFNVIPDVQVIAELMLGRRPARPTGPIANQWLDDISWEYCQQCTAAEPAMRPSMNDVLSHLQKIFNLSL